VDEGYAMGRKEAEKALILDPNLAAAYTNIGYIKLSYDWDWNGADAAFKRALELDPANAILGAASLASTLGRFDEAIALTRRAIELDPIPSVYHNNLGVLNFYAGRLDESEAAFRKALELNPKRAIVHSFLGLIYLARSKPFEALAEMQKEPEPVYAKQGMALAYYAAGKKKEADIALADYIAEFQNDAAFQIAQIYAFRGEKDKAFEWLERAYKQSDSGLITIKGDPLLRNIEKDPRYTAFLQKMKLPI
jgi:tetratricopeptide (TPR) repeat protein